MTEEYEVVGGLNTYDHSGSLSNLRQSIATEPYPGNTNLIDSLQPTLIHGVIPSTASDIISSITAKQDPNGEVSLGIHQDFIGTLVQYSAAGNGATQNAYTITTGKKFYLMGFRINGLAKQGQVYKTDGATIITILNSSATVPSLQTGGFGLPLWIYNSAEIVKVFGTDASTQLEFWGFEK